MEHTKGSKILSPHHEPVKLSDSEQVFVYPAIACALSFILIICIACYCFGRVSVASVVRG